MMSASELALLGGAPVGDMSAPGPYPRFTQEAMDRVAELMQRGATVGLNKNNPEIAELEAAVAEWQGVAYCLGTSSGHAALHSALIGLEVSWGDEVITTPYTWGASTSCILHNNAIPVFADVDPETGLLDPASVQECITPRTKAILVVHIYGQPADMTAIRAIADRHGLSVVEDGSQAHGAVHRGKKVGQYGDAAGFSCMGGKLLASSEAGYMITPHEEVYWKAAMGGQHMGRSPEEDFPDELQPYVDSLVYTYRLNPVNAVLLTEQIIKIDAENEARRVNVSILRTAMEGVQCVTFPDYPEGDLPSYHMLTMNFQPEVAGISRSTYLAALRAEGVPAFHYVPTPISQWKRLGWQDYDGPKVMWTEALRQSGIDYGQVEVPSAELKIARSIEISWNYIDVDEAKMLRLAAAFEKVEANLDALREWEQKREE
jgi:dTDP-4-amino-4,6-dideoxygalactose transaminase